MQADQSSLPPCGADYTVDPERSLPLPKENWKMFVDERGQVFAQTWFAPAIVYGWARIDPSDLPNDQITASDLERFGVTVHRVDGVAVAEQKR